MTDNVADLETVLLGLDALTEQINTLNEIVSKIENTVSVIPIAIQVANRRKE